MPKRYLFTTSVPVTTALAAVPGATVTTFGTVTEGIIPDVRRAGFDAALPATPFLVEDCPDQTTRLLCSVRADLISGGVGNAAAIIADATARGAQRS